MWQMTAHLLKTASSTRSRVAINGLLALLRSLMDLSLGPAGERYALTPDLPGIACHGHFTPPDRAWEEKRF